MLFGQTTQSTKLLPFCISTITILAVSFVDFWSCYFSAHISNCFCHVKLWLRMSAMPCNLPSSSFLSSFISETVHSLQLTIADICFLVSFFMTSPGSINSLTLEFSFSHISLCNAKPRLLSFLLNSWMLQTLLSQLSSTNSWFIFPSWSALFRTVYGGLTVHTSNTIFVLIFQTVTYFPFANVTIHFNTSQRPFTFARFHNKRV